MHIVMLDFFMARNVSGRKMFRGWKCLGAGLVSRPDLSRHSGARLVLKLDLSQGRSYIRFKVWKYFVARSAQKPDLSNIEIVGLGFVSRPDLSRHSGAGLVLKLDLSQGRSYIRFKVWKYFVARSAQKPDLSNIEIVGLGFIS